MQRDRLVKQEFDCLGFGLELVQFGYVMRHRLIDRDLRVPIIGLDGFLDFISADSVCRNNK